MASLDDGPWLWSCCKQALRRGARRHEAGKLVPVKSFKSLALDTEPGRLAPSLCAPPFCPRGSQTQQRGGGHGGSAGASPPTGHGCGYRGFGDFGASPAPAEYTAGCPPHQVGPGSETEPSEAAKDKEERMNCRDRDEGEGYGTPRRGVLHAISRRALESSQALLQRCCVSVGALTWGWRVTGFTGPAPSSYSAKGSQICGWREEGVRCL